MQEEAFYSLEAPIRRVAGVDVGSRAAAGRGLVPSRRGAHRRRARRVVRCLNVPADSLPPARSRRGHDRSRARAVAGRGRRPRDARPDRRPRADRQGRGGAAGPGVGHHRAPRRRGRRPRAGRRAAAGARSPTTAPRSAAPRSAASRPTTVSAPPAPSTCGASTAPERAAGRVALAAPPVRKLAKELGVDLATVGGTGPGGRVTAADVRGRSAPRRRSRDRREPLRGVRRAMARNLAEAWREVPHISLFDEIDARPLLAAHTRGPRARDDAITLTALFVRAAVVAIEAFPILNSSLDVDRDEVVFHGAVHIGVAVASDDGLVVPVVHDAHERDLLDLGRGGRARHRGRSRRSPLTRDAPRRDVHRHQLRHRGRPLRHPDRPTAAGRDPRLRRGAGAPGGRR